MQALLAQLDAPAPGEPAAKPHAPRRSIAAHRRVDLVVLPGALPLRLRPARARETAVDLDGDEPSRPCAGRRAPETALMVGLRRAARRAVANSLACIDARGDVAAVYRKLHLFGAEAGRLRGRRRARRSRSSAGAASAPLICFDMEFPEPARSLAAAGADLLVTAAANMEPFFDDQLIAAPGTRARQPAPAPLRQPGRSARSASSSSAARARCAPTAGLGEVAPAAARRS